ncbi:MAG: DNA/RNA nuclease SfsA [Deltaproteobacteria bacterium]|jgi:sugar fermentation stimulation protein A|nr:DNA/RNA nuclease SfsA [Deltaproteobacteria bacterium]
MREKGCIPFPPLTEGRLIRRYKRFLADVELKGGEVVTAHTGNTGRMTLCSEPGRRVYLSESQNPKRKLRYTWELIDMGGEAGLVGVNTSLPNRLAALWLGQGLIGGVPMPDTLRTEARHGNSRLDILLGHPGGKSTFVEVKNCTLAEGGIALFPDAPSLRAAKHMGELAGIAESGDRAMVLIVVARGDASKFAPADHIDPAFGRALRDAMGRGVELRAFRAGLSAKGAWLGRELPCLPMGPVREG